MVMLNAPNNVTVTNNIVLYVVTDIKVTADVQYVCDDEMTF